MLPTEASVTTANRHSHDCRSRAMLRLLSITRSR